MRRREFLGLLGGAAALAARSACAAARAHASHWRAHAHDSRRAGRAGPPCGVPARDAGGGLEGRPQPADRNPLERRRCRAPAQKCGGARRAQPGRNPGRARPDRGDAAAGEPHRADRVRADRRSGWLRRRQQHVATGRQRHRLPPVRLRPERKMARAAQGGRAAGQARGRPPRILEPAPGPGSGLSSRPSRGRPGWS